MSITSVPSGSSSLGRSKFIRAHNTKQDSAAQLPENTVNGDTVLCVNEQGKPIRCRDVQWVVRSPRSTYLILKTLETCRFGLILLAVEHPSGKFVVRAFGMLFDSLVYCLLFSEEICCSGVLSFFVFVVETKHRC